LKTLVLRSRPVPNIGVCFIEFNRSQGVVVPLKGTNNGQILRPQVDVFLAVSLDWISIWQPFLTMNPKYALDLAIFAKLEDEVVSSDVTRYRVCSVVADSWNSPGNIGQCLPSRRAWP
jgi:hypothetical protein